MLFFVKYVLFVFFGGVRGEEKVFVYGGSYFEMLLYIFFGGGENEFLLMFCLCSSCCLFNLVLCYYGDT